MAHSRSPRWALATLREWLRWFLVITFAALVVLVSATLPANLMQTPHLPISPLLAIAGLALGQVIMIAWLFRRFRVPPDAQKRADLADGLITGALQLTTGRYVDRPIPCILDRPVLAASMASHNGNDLNSE